MHRKETSLKMAPWKIEKNVRAKLEMKMVRTGSRWTVWLAVPGISSGKPSAAAKRWLVAVCKLSPQPRCMSSTNGAKNGCIMVTAVSVYSVSDSGKFSLNFGYFFFTEFLQNFADEYYFRLKLQRNLMNWCPLYKKTLSALYVSQTSIILRSETFYMKYVAVSCKLIFNEI
jgi:hypothetical protein